MKNPIENGNKKSNLSTVRNEDELRETLYYKHDIQVEFGVEQAHGYPFNGGWVYPDIENASPLDLDEQGDPIKKYTR